MSSYLGPIPSIPTLAPTNIYEEDQQPLRDQLDKIYTDVSNVVNDKKRKDTYLLEEDITIDTWVDGKPIFRKTIATGTINQGATNNISHGISTIDDLVDIRVVVDDGGSPPNRKILPYASPTAANAASVDVTNTNVVIITGASFGTAYTGYIYIQYTKI